MRTILGLVLMAVAIVALITLLVAAVYEEVADYRERHGTSRRALRAEWRIHQIKGEAQHQMWDAVTRGRPRDQ